MLEFTRRRALQLLVALFALAAPQAASAQGPVQRFLQGGVVDPSASVVYVEPPRGGMVMVYEGNRPVGVLPRAGTLALRPGRVYGVVATRGSAMLFNQRLRLGAGLTSLVWAPGQSAPHMSFRPRFAPPRAPRPVTRAPRPAPRARPRPTARPAPRARAPRRSALRRRLPAATARALPGRRP